MGKIIHSSVGFGYKILCDSVHSLLYFARLDPWRPTAFLLVFPAFKSTSKSSCLLTPLQFAAQIHCLCFGSELPYGAMWPSVMGFSPLVISSRLVVYTGGPWLLIPSGDLSSPAPGQCGTHIHPALCLLTQQAAHVSCLRTCLHERFPDWAYTHWPRVTSGVILQGNFQKLLRERKVCVLRADACRKHPVIWPHWESGGWLIGLGQAVTPPDVNSTCTNNSQVLLWVWEKWTDARVLCGSQEVPLLRTLSVYGVFYMSLASHGFVFGCGFSDWSVFFLCIGCWKA